MLPPIRSPLRTEPFAELTRPGLFAAPWMEHPSEAAVQAVQDMSRELAQHDISPNELTAVLSYLLAVRGHCLLAARQETAARVREHYQDALRACRTVTNLLHHATEGTPGALATWSTGVHSLIEAQLALPDLAASERLARDALVKLSCCTGEALCDGAEADAAAATRLAREPAELASQLEDLPTSALDKLDFFKYRTDYLVSMLNARLGGIHESYRRAFGDVLLWGLANLVMMASLPLNGFFRPDIPWSIPPVLGVLFLWWWTWDGTFRENLPFFVWVRWVRSQSISLFHEATEQLINPAAEYSSSMATMLRDGRTARDRLAAYCLFALPEKWETLDQAATIGTEGMEILAGDWLAEMDDHHPWPLAELLPVDPTMLPHALRIFHGTSQR
jgi:hypothetical protein